MRGDTIIEVLLAFTVFSLVSVGGMAVMNQGTNSAERSLEATLVKEQIDMQAEALRAAQQAYFSSRSNPDPSLPAKATWNDIATSRATSDGNTTNCTTVPSNAFIMNPRTATKLSNPITPMNSATAPPYSQVSYNPAGGITGVYGIWVELHDKVSSLNAPDAYDFRVRACWFAPGTDVPMELQTIVRLYG